MDVTVVSADGQELRGLTEPSAGERRIIGLAGAPGSGKSRLAEAMASLHAPTATHLPMDGFHLADVELVRQGLLDRKGAPETFDAAGYAALLRRLRQRPAYPVYAPGFDRNLEQPLAGAIPVEHRVDLVLTEGNYLLMDRSEWRAVREQLDEVWYVFTDERVRLARLRARHVEFGKDRDAAAVWVERVDESNARLVEATRSSADRLVDLSAWGGKIVGSGQT